MTDADRAALLSEYYAAVDEERARWKELHNTPLDPVEGVKIYARWRLTAERARRLALELRAGAVPRPDATPPGN